MNKPPPKPGLKPQSAPNRPRPGAAAGAGGPMPPGQIRKPQQSPPSTGPGELTGALTITRRPPWYKRKYLVYPRFQLTLIIMNSIVTVCLFSLTALLVVRSHIYLEALVRQTRIPAQNLFTQLLSQQLHTLLIYMVIGLVVGVVTTGIATLLLSHKMAGPMVRLKNFFTNISKTSEFPESLNFRDGDFFQELPPVINQAFNALKRKWHR